MYAVIMAGGVGTRLWPRSRESRPKQFSDITGSGLTMIQQTAARLQGVVDGPELYVVTGAAYAGLTTEQLPQMPANHVIVEPSGRNTAPAIGLACLHLRRRDPDAIVAVLPADHVILQPERFRTALQRAGEIAAQGFLVTLGIEPTSAHTGYGYIKRAEVLSGDSVLPAYRVERFLEKPKRITAEQFLAEGGYYWNGGIFVSRVATMLNELARQAPAIYERLMQIDAAMAGPDVRTVLQKVWQSVPSVSIDYAVMEGARQVAVVPMQAGWNDVGSWDALEGVLAPDEMGNAIAGGEALLLDSSNNIVYSEKRLVALINMNNIVVVDTGDTLLIGDKSNMQRVKDIVEKLRAQGRSELL